MQNYFNRSKLLFLTAAMDGCYYYSLGLYYL